MKTPALPLKVRAYPTPLYFIGDSHCIAFNNLHFRDPASHLEYLSIAKYVPNLNGDRVMLEGNINPHLLWALAAESLIVERDGGWLARHVVEGTPDPPIVFFCGEIDVRGMAAKLGDEADFVLPFPLPDADRFAYAENRRVVPLSIIEDAVNMKVWNTLSALHRLATAGFRNVFLHSIAPDSAKRPALVRYRLAAFFQLLFSSNIANIGARFLNVWDSVTEHNMLRPEFYLDGIHLNKSASLVTMRALFAQLGYPGNPELVSRLQPVYALGDQRAAAVHRVVYGREGSQERFVVRGHHLPDLRFATALEGPGAANQSLMRALFSDMLTIFDFETRQFFAAHRPTTPAGDSLVKATLRSRRDPTLAFFVGDDEIEKIAQHDDPFAEASVRVGVFLAALESLRQGGFRNICVAPLSERAGERALYTDLIRAINAQLAERCASAGAVFLRDLVASDMAATLLAIDEVRRAREREPLGEIYEMSYIIATLVRENSGPALDPVPPEWSERGAVTIAHDPRLAKRLATTLDFGAHGDIVRPDWAADELTHALGETDWAVLTFEDLYAVAQLLYDPATQRVLESILRCESVAPSIRSFRVPESGWPKWQTAMPPTGVLHATLSLADRDGGAIVLRDRERYEGWMRTLEPGSEHVDIVVMPADAYFGPYVAEAGRSAWPIDPVNISTEGVTLVRPD